MAETIDWLVPVYVRELDSMNKFIVVTDAISELAGRAAGWMFFAAGFFVAYEVFMRYALISPTVWVDEISRIIQVWATYLATATVLKYREHVTIDLAFREVHLIHRRIVETFSLCVIAFFSLVAAKYGWDLWLKSTLAGHTTDSYLAVPKVYIQSSIWVGFGLLGLQCLAEIIKIWTRKTALQRSELGRH